MNRSQKLALLFLCFLCSQNSFASKKLAKKKACSRRIAEYQKTLKSIEANEFKVSRGFWTFSFIFERKSFYQFFINSANAAKKVSWIDWGAGLAVPQLEFLELNGFLPKTPKLDIDMTSLSFKIPEVDDYKNPQNKTQVKVLKKAIEKGEIDYRTGDMNESLDIEKRFNLATDVVGALSYVKNMTQCLDTQFRSLDKGALFFIHTAADSFILRDGDKTYNLMEFLKTIPGLQVTFLSNRSDNVSFSGSGLSFVVKKLKKDVVIPDLELVDWQDDIPPIRIFQRVNR